MSTALVAPKGQPWWKRVHNRVHNMGNFGTASRIRLLTPDTRNLKPKQGWPTMKKITDAEYLSRISAAQEKMAANGIDAIIAHSHEADFVNVRYFSNYWPLFETGVFLSRKRVSPLWLSGPSPKHLLRVVAKSKTLPKFLSIESLLNLHNQVLSWIRLKVLPKNPVASQNLRK